MEADYTWNCLNGPGAFPTFRETAGQQDALSGPDGVASGSLPLFPFRRVARGAQSDQKRQPLACVKILSASSCEF